MIDAASAAIVVGFIALGGVIVTTWNSRAQLRLQLAHDADQRDRERTMAMRRDVYLPALEAVVSSHGALQRIIDVNADIESIQKTLVSDTATYAKVHLVARESTIRALLNFQERLIPANIKLLGYRMTLAGYKTAITSEQQHLANTQATVTRLNAFMERLTLSPEHEIDHGVLERLNQQLQAAIQSIGTHYQNISGIEQRRNAELLRIIEAADELSAHVAEAMPEALIAARSELDMPVDADYYRTILAHQLETVRTANREFLDSIRASIAQQR